MTIYSAELEVSTAGRGYSELTRAVAEHVDTSAVTTGLCSLFIRHTSASLMICENADPEVLRDLERFMRRLVVDGDAAFHHDAEGPDDMAAHIRSVLTHTDLNLPIRHGQLDLGTWQGIYLWEHRLQSHRRRITITILGEA